VYSQHGLQRLGRAAAFGIALGIVGLNQIDESLTGRQSLHQGQESLPLGAFPRGGLLVITESELLVSHEPSYLPLRSQRHCRVDTLGYPEIKIFPNTKTIAARLA